MRLAQWPLLTSLKTSWFVPMRECGARRVTLKYACLDVDTLKRSTPTACTGRPGGLVVIIPLNACIVEFVLELEPHVGRTFSFTFTCKKRNQKEATTTAESACSAGRRNSMRVDKGRKD